MKNIVLITGDLAAGKSTLADNLSQALNFTCIKKDCVKEIICDSVGFSTREENRRISVATVNSMTHFLEQTLKIGGDLILEANFRLSEISKIQELINRYNANLNTIYLFGDEKVLFDRFVKRAPTRNRAHMSQGLDKDYNKYVSYIKELRNEIEDIDAYRIDVTSISEVELLNKVVSFLKKV